MNPNYMQWFQMIEGTLNASPHNRDTDWWIGARRFKGYSLVMGLNVPRVDLNIDKQDSYILQSKSIFLIVDTFERNIYCFSMNIFRKKMFQNRIVISFRDYFYLAFFGNILYSYFSIKSMNIISQVLFFNMWISFKLLFEFQISFQFEYQLRKNTWHNSLSTHYK